VSKERDSELRPRIIFELDELIEQATAERSHYYVRSVAEKAQLAIGMLMSENARLEAKHERVLKMLEQASKRSNYEWSNGPDYFPSDYANEGRVALALEVLAQIESLK